MIAQLGSLVDQLAGCPPSWKAANMPKSGRMILVQSVLCAIPIHVMMALDIPMKTITAMVKICRGARQGSSKWWPVHGGMGQGMLTEVGWWARYSKPTLAEHSYSGMLAMVTTGGQIQTMGRVRHHRARGVYAVV